MKNEFMKPRILLEIILWLIFMRSWYKHFASNVQRHDNAFFDSNSISSERENVDQMKTQETDN
jgi:hypothetical protein